LKEEVRFFLSRESKRKIYTAMILGVVVVLTIGQAHAGFLFIVLALPLTVWLSWSLFVIVRQPYARLAQFISIFVWMIAIGLVVGAHYVRHEVARGDANRIVAAIDRFAGDSGRCPPSLESIGFKRAVVEEALGSNYTFACVDRKPKFSYVATFTIFDTFDYDFDRDTWNYVSWAEKKKFLDTRPAGVVNPQASPSTPSPAPGFRPVPQRAP
jgi:hypothetical protein